jgi:hypothetical protein
MSARLIGEEEGNDAADRPYGAAGIVTGAGKGIGGTVAPALVDGGQVLPESRFALT